jgi:hypothetical protein
MTPEDLQRLAREGRESLDALPNTSQPLWYRAARITEDQKEILENLVDDWGGCTTEGCPGDGRYAAPGRGHVEECTYPLFGDAYHLSLKNMFSSGDGEKAAKEWSELYDNKPNFMGVSVTNGVEEKPIETIGQVISIDEDEMGVYIVAKLDPAYVTWLERSRTPQNRSEVRPWWYPFTRIKKLLWRS